MERTIHRWAPLTGVAFVVLTIVALALGGESPDFDDRAEDVVEYFVDNEGANIAGSVVQALGAVILLFFAATLARIVHGRNQVVLPWVVLGGGIVASAGLGVDAAIRFATVEAANNIDDPVVAQTLNALWANFFMPMVVGLAALVVAASIAALRTRVFPAWLAWIGLLIFVLFFTPIGFVAFLGSALWILVISVLLFVKEGREPTIAGSAATPAA